MPTHRTACSPACGCGTGMLSRFKARVLIHECLRSRLDYQAQQWVGPLPSILTWGLRPFTRSYSAEGHLKPVAAYLSTLKAVHAAAE